MLHQFLAAGAVTIYSFVGTLIIGYAVNVFIKNRVTDEQELEGLDTSIHGESAYDWGGIGTSGHLGSTATLSTSASSSSSKESVTA